VVDEIETGEIIDRAIVRTEAIGSDSTNRECLQEMDDRNVTELAVVDSENTFVNIVTQDAIIRKLMSSALSEV
jgi:predicted transcriptional regulator